MISSKATTSILSKKARLALGLGAAATTVYSSLYTVKGGERAVLVDRFHGTLPESVGEGTRFLIPWVQKPYILDIRARTHTLSAISATNDHEPVNLTLRVISRPNVQCLPTIVQNLGLEYDKILHSIANEVLESVVAKSSPLMLFISHSWYFVRVRDAFVQRAKDLNILIDEVDITCFSCTDNPKLFEQKLMAPTEEKDNFMITLMTECQKRPEKCDALKTLRRFERCQKLDIIGDLSLDFMNMQFDRNPPY